jgi:hypothetical protein
MIQRARELDSEWSRNFSTLTKLRAPFKIQDLNLYLLIPVQLRRHATSYLDINIFEVLNLAQNFSRPLRKAVVVMVKANEFKQD